MSKSLPTVPPPPRPSAITVMTHGVIAARFWMLLTVVGFAGWVVIPQLTILAMKQQEKVAVIDQSGNIIYAPLSGFMQSEQLHAYHVRLACLALFQRNPNGFDMPELFDKLFIEPAKAKGMQILKTEAAEFDKKKIHQKVEITSINILETRKITDNKKQNYDASDVVATGFLSKRGVINGIEFREDSEIRITFTFIKNNNMVSNGMLPLVAFDVSSFQETRL
ncbi:MAG TPA: hypothetical protein VIS99_12765 [Terrimicrobiaceae bacterium]